MVSLTILKSPGFESHLAYFIEKFPVVGGFLRVLFIPTPSRND